MAHAQRKEAEGGDCRKLDSRLHLTEEIMGICREIASYGGSDIAKGEFAGGRVVSYGRPSSEQSSELEAVYAPLYLKSLARHREITIRYYMGFPGSQVELLVDGKKALEARKFTLSGALLDSKIDDGLVTLELLDQLLQLRSLVKDAKGQSIYRSNAAKTLRVLERR
jgi:hypothetical protein